MIPLITRAIALISEVLGLAKTILGLSEQAAQEHAPYAIETIASNGTNTVINPTYGNSALRQLLLDVLSGIDVPNSTVVLPPSPPSGYGGASTADLDGQMQWVLPFDNTFEEATLRNFSFECQSHATMIAAQQGYLDSRNPYFALCTKSAHWAQLDTRGVWGSTEYPAPDPIDWTDWDGSESLVAFLNRSDTQYTWQTAGPDGVSVPGCAWAYSYGYTQMWWRCLVKEWELPLVSGRWLTLLGQGSGTPPVWPSLAEVTLGTPVALSDDLTVEGPLDGVLIHVTNIPKGLGRFTVGERTFFYKCGEIAFVSDNGYVEPWQYMTWDHGLYTPKCMQHADHAIIRALSDATGTATPWSVTV